MFLLSLLWLYYFSLSLRNTELQHYKKFSELVLTQSGLNGKDIMRYLLILHWPFQMLEGLISNCILFDSCVFCFVCAQSALTIQSGRNEMVTFCMLHLSPHGYKLASNYFTTFYFLNGIK